MRTEEERAGRLLDAQASAVALFDEVVTRGIVAPGRGEQEVSDQIRDLANEMFGKTRHWHKRIVRSGPHTLFPYRENPPDRVIRIQELFAAGLHSKKIARLLPCMRDADGGPSEIATPALVDELTAERERIDRTITELISSREVLSQVIDAAAATEH